MEKMMQRLTMDKATQYTRKAVDKLRHRTEELVRGLQYHLLQSWCLGVGTMQSCVITFSMLPVFFMLRDLHYTTPVLILI